MWAIIKRGENWFDDDFQFRKKQFIGQISDFSHLQHQGERRRIVLLDDSRSPASLSLFCSLVAVAVLAPVYSNNRFIVTKKNLVICF